MEPDWEEDLGSGPNKDHRGAANNGRKSFCTGMLLLFRIKGKIPDCKRSKCIQRWLSKWKTLSFLQQIWFSSQNQQASIKPCRTVSSEQSIVQQLEVWMFQGDVWPPQIRHFSRQLRWQNNWMTSALKGRLNDLQQRCEKLGTHLKWMVSIGAATEQPEPPTRLEQKEKNLQNWMIHSCKKLHFLFLM